MSIVVRDKPTVKINNKLKRNNLFGLGFVSLIAACGGSEDASNLSLADNRLPEITDQEREDQEREEQEREDQEREEQEREEQERIDQEQERIDQEREQAREQARWNPESVHLNPDNRYQFYYSTEDGEKIQVRWPEGGKTNLKIPVSDHFDYQAKGEASLNFLAMRGKYDLIFNTPSYQYSNEGEVRESAGLVAIYWDIHYGFNIDSPHLSIIGASAEDYLGMNSNRISNDWHQPSQGISFYQIEGIDGILDMVIYSQRVDNGNKRDVGGIYIIWDINQYRDTSEVIDLNNFENFNVLAIIGGRGDTHSDRIGEGEMRMVNLNDSDNKIDLVIEEPNVEGGRGAVYIIWNVADYAGGARTIDLYRYSPNPSSGMLKIVGKPNAHFGEDRTGLVLRKSANDSTEILRDFNNRGKHDLVFNDGESTFVLFAETLRGDTITGTIMLESSHNNSFFVLREYYISPTTSVSHKYRTIGYRTSDLYYNVDDFYKDHFTVSGSRRADFVVGGINRAPTEISQNWEGLPSEPIDEDIDTDEGEDTPVVAYGRPVSVDLDPASSGQRTISATVLWSKNNGESELVFNNIDSTASDVGALGYYLARSRADLLINLADFSGEGSAKSEVGMIYIYWSITSSLNIDTPHLSIIGASSGDKIGYDISPLFFRIEGGRDDVDMIFSSSLVDNGNKVDAGGIYIIWDINQYRGKPQAEQNIDLADFSGFDVLEILGGSAGDNLGEDAIRLASINRIDNKHEMVIENPNAEGGRGALYIIWNIGDHAGKAATIDLHKSAAKPSEGVLTIIGKSGQHLGAGNTGFVFKESSSSNKQIVKDFDDNAEYDLMVFDGQYTYLFFGEALMNARHKGNLVSPNTKTQFTRTIELDKIQLLAASDGNQFFSYDFDGRSGISDIERGIGYRTGDDYSDISSFYDSHFYVRGWTVPKVGYAAMEAGLVSKNLIEASRNRPEWAPPEGNRNLDEMSEIAASLSGAQGDGSWDIA